MLDKFGVYEEIRHVSFDTGHCIDNKYGQGFIPLKIQYLKVTK